MLNKITTNIYNILGLEMSKTETALDAMYKLHGEGKFDEAIAKGEATLSDIGEELSGLEKISIKYQIAFNYFHKADYKAALEILDTIEKEQHHHKADADLSYCWSMEKAKVVNLQGECHKMQGNFPAALERYNALTHANFQRHNEGCASFFLIAQNNKAHALLMMGNFAKSEAVAKDVLQKREESGANPAHISTSHKQVALALFAQGKNEEGFAHAEQCYSMRKNAPAHKLAEAELVLAIGYILHKGDTKKANELMEQAAQCEKVQKSGTTENKLYEIAKKAHGVFRSNGSQKALINGLVHPSVAQERGGAAACV